MTSSQVLTIPNGLAGWRHKKGVSLSAIAAATNINPRYLEAIERGEFHKLPDGVYRVSYIRQYARAIHYDEHELVSYYRSASAELQPVPDQAVSPFRQRRISRILGRLSAFLIPNKYRGLLHRGA